MYREAILTLIHLANLYMFGEHMQFVVASSIWFLAISLLLLMFSCRMPEQADTFLILWWMGAIIFAIYAKVDSVVINGSRTKPPPSPPLPQYAHISNSISLLCECGSTFNLYLVHTHTLRQAEREGGSKARTQRDKCIDQNVWQHVLVPIRLTPAHTHTRAHVSLHMSYMCVWYICLRGVRQHLCKLKCK